MKQAGGYPTLNNLKDGWFTHGDDIVLENWYALDDSTMSSQVLGGLTEISVLDNAALADAIAERSARIFCLNPERMWGCLPLIRMDEVEVGLLSTTTGTTTSSMWCWRYCRHLFPI